MANCVFPEDIMLCILTRLPVKSILRFKSVCKPWCKLIETPMFMKIHHQRFSNDPKNQAVIIYSLSGYHYHTMSLFKIESDEKKPTNLDHPYPEIFFRMDFIGCCNGLICMGCPPLGQGIVLWNPAMKLFNSVRLSKVDFGVPEMVSLGFGTIKVGFHFRVLWTKNDAIVNGNPYWVAKIDENENAKCQLGEVLVWFDVKKLAFKIVLLSGLNLGEGSEVPLVDWRGSLAALVCKKNNKIVESLDVWVFDDSEQIWRNNHTFGPIEVKVDRFLQCSKNWKILGECPNGKLFVFDPSTGRVKEIVIDEARKRSFEIYGYTESLAYIKGMEKVVGYEKCFLIDAGKTNAIL
ncbi:hypothetical protein DH2020_019329 [Rehmannia glutinosa]|uniref:F-box domain-containing protein n=1 Tax=Rehmannia glutinosa TaxID=99300 RepID=A0ABR0WLP9_REHGL